MYYLANYNEKQKIHGGEQTNAFPSWQFTDGLEPGNCYLRGFGTLHGFPLEINHLSADAFMGYPAAGLVLGEEITPRAGDRSRPELQDRDSSRAGPQEGNPRDSLILELLCSQSRVGAQGEAELSCPPSPCAPLRSIRGDLGRAGWYPGFPGHSFSWAQLSQHPVFPGHSFS